MTVTAIHEEKKKPTSSNQQQSVAPNEYWANISNQVVQNM